MKKIMVLFLCLLLLFTTAYASSTSYRAVPTDIRVFLHGKEIPSCAVNNSMYISADDFAEYGYTVTYIDEVRTLFVNKTGMPSDIMPEPCRVKEFAETDIRVLFNGTDIVRNAIYAANGKIYVNTSILAHGSPFEQWGYPNELTSTWDGKNRILYIEDNVLPSKDEQIERFLSYNGNREEYTFLSFGEERFAGDGYEIVKLTVGGLPGGSSTEWFYAENSGKSYNLNEVTSIFRMYNPRGRCSISNPRVEGRRLYFDGMRTMNLAVPSEGIYEGKYYLDLDTTVVHTIEEAPVG